VIELNAQQIIPAERKMFRVLGDAFISQQYPGPATFGGASAEFGVRLKTNMTKSIGVAIF
jgi:hypothetical protein